MYAFCTAGELPQAEEGGGINGKRGSAQAGREELRPLISTADVWRPRKAGLIRDFLGFGAGVEYRVRIFRRVGFRLTRLNRFFLFGHSSKAGDQKTQVE